MQRNMLEEGGSIIFNIDLFHYISLVCLYVCAFIPYLKILGSVSFFGSNPVSVAFVDKQPPYASTATETEFIVI